MARHIQSIADEQYVVTDLGDLFQPARAALLRDELQALRAERVVTLGAPPKPQPLRYAYNYWVEVWRLPSNPDQGRLRERLADCAAPNLRDWPSAIR